MTQQTDLTAVARERADQRIDQALGDLRKAAREIGEKHGIPDGIAGHSIEELLGRMTYVPSMARDLRRVAGQELAKQEMRHVFEASAAPPPPELYGSGPIKDSRKPETLGKPPPQIDASKLPPQAPVGMDVGDLSGVTVQAVKALRQAGLTKVGDLLNVPDEHLLKISGLAEKSVAQIREAVARAMAPAG